MPEFILDCGDRDSALKFKALDSFTQGYIEAMFFTSTGPDDELKEAHVGELAPEAWQMIQEDCAKFQADNAALLEAALASDWRGKPNDYGEVCYDDERAGRDFWFTRNGHGVGYWDRGLGAIGERLSSACRAYRELDLYRGDDELLYLT